jgi:hypothetical protein
MVTLRLDVIGGSSRTIANQSIGPWLDELRWQSLVPIEFGSFRFLRKKILVALKRLQSFAVRHGESAHRQEAGEQESVPASIFEGRPISVRDTFSHPVQSLYRLF